MAWGNLAAVGNLLAALSQPGGWGGQQKGKGKGGKGKDYQSGGPGGTAQKGGGKGAGKGDQGFQCRCQDCDAGVGQIPTRTLPHCHGCQRPKGQAMNPPLEYLAEWAFRKKCSSCDWALVWIISCVLVTCTGNRDVA